MTARALALWLAALLTLVACGGGGGGGDGPAATLDVIDLAADVRASGADDFVAGEDGAGLVIGDDVRTDRTGFAEITYPDGSLTRVDRDTQFRVVALGEAADAPDVQVELGAGRAWNRVQELGDGGRFEVDTSIATAAVRGTAFDIDCAFGCLFRVVDGTVEVTNDAGESVTLDAGQGVQVRDDGSFGPVLALVELGQDPWIATNLDLDEQGGADPVAPAADPDTSQAGLGGTWDVRFVATDESTDPTAPEGSTSDVTFAIEPACESGPCDGVIDAGQAGTFDLVLVDGVHTIDDTEQTATQECPTEPVFDRRVTGELVVSALVGDDPTQAGVFVGIVREEFTPLPGVVEAGCTEQEDVRVRVSTVRGVLRP